MLNHGKRLGRTVGGFQGGEGAAGAAEWNVENVFEELDSPNEWFYDQEKKDLYFFHNGAKHALPQFILRNPWPMGLS